VCIQLTGPSDNPINQTILSTFMKRKRIKFETAADGVQAIEKYKKGNFHLILVGFNSFHTP
jgi:osomolarity two-component system response regulator SSK1